VVPEQFSWDAAGAALAGIIEHQLRLRHGVRRPSLAVVSPFPPEQCGPSAYIAQLLAGGDERCDITAVTSAEPAQVVLPGVNRVERLSSLDHLEDLRYPFEEVVYFIGNSHFHAFYPEFLRRRPGAVVLHDVRLTGLYGEIARLRPDLLRGRTFQETLHDMYPGRYPNELGASGRLLPEEADRYGVLMVADIVRTATSVYVHSEYAADLVEIDCGIRPHVIFPLPVPDWPFEREEGDPNLIGTFGIVDPVKAPDLLIEALALCPGARLAFVGPIATDHLAELTALARRLGLEDRVEFTGQVDDDTYTGWLRRVGVMVQLRRWSNGESSLAVSEAIASGTPLVINSVGAFGELPADVALRVPAQASTTDLAAAFTQASTDAATRRSLLTAQAAYAEAHQYPRALARLVETLLGLPNRP
jgi:glycosyltransferase involved in cell wall biosynthesis